MSKCLGEKISVLFQTVNWGRFGLGLENINILCWRDSFWPGGILAETSPERKKDLKVRTRVAAKTKMFGSIPGIYIFCRLFSSSKLIEAVSGSEILLTFNFKIKWEGCGLLPLYVGEFMCHSIAPTLVVGSTGHQITKDWRQRSGRKLGLPPWIKGHANDKMTRIFLPLTKRFGNARLESQKYTTFPVVLFEFLWKIRNVQNGSPVFVVGMCQTEITHL